ncbi:MAG: hypothetical protein HYV07_26575 [Deltaproteobacteria bacterium]|nr:hypothetical protein [Deltaproteobacteria bacterium]
MSLKTVTTKPKGSKPPPIEPSPAPKKRASRRALPVEPPAPSSARSRANGSAKAAIIKPAKTKAARTLVGTREHPVGKAPRPDKRRAAEPAKAPVRRLSGAEPKPSKPNRVTPKRERAKPEPPNERNAPKKLAKDAPPIPTKVKAEHTPALSLSKRPPKPPKRSPSAEVRSRRTPKEEAPAAEPVSPRASVAAVVEEPKSEKPKVVRLAAGLREKKRAQREIADVLDSLPKRVDDRLPPAPPRAPSLKKEINPRLERSKPWADLKAPGPPPAQEAQPSEAPASEAAGEKKPMSVAQKNRAKVESVFSKLIGRESESPTTVEPTEVPFAARPGGQTAFDSPRINPIDSLTTRLRLSSDREELLAAARELASTHHLPPDPTLLLKVLALKEADLVKAALDAMLELHDRGRVRRSPELARLISDVPTFGDRDTQELKQLLLAKIGG